MAGEKPPMVLADRLKAGAGRLRRAPDSWLLAPEQNAAGRMGLFRIVYAVFYLWQVAWYPASLLEEVPAAARGQLYLLGAIRRAVPYVPADWLEAGLVAALVVLLLGWRTRVATWVVLALGMLIEIQYQAIEPQKARVFYTVIIPLFMGLSGDWGATYSLDASRRPRNRVSPSDDSGAYFVPARAILVLLSILFFGAALSKICGVWPDEPYLMARIALSKNIKAVIYDLPPVNPLFVAFASRPWLYESSRYVVIAFEALFPLALIGGTTRRIIVASTLVFHGLNALLLLVTFTPILVVYLLYIDLIDLQAAAGRLTGHSSKTARLRGAMGRWFTRGPTVRADAIVLAVAIGFGAFWISSPVLPTVLRVGGLLDWRTIWLVVAPAAMVWLVVLIFQGAGGIIARSSALSQRGKLREAGRPRSRWSTRRGDWSEPTGSMIPGGPLPLSDGPRCGSGKLGSPPDPEDVAEHERDE